MTPLAHAGHWAAQLLYLGPVVALVGVVLWNKWRGRGTEDDVEDRDDRRNDS